MGAFGSGRKEYRKERRRFYGALKLAGQQYGLADLMALDELRSGLRARTEGFEEAQRVTSGISRESRRGAVDRASQASGQARGRFGPSGVGTTAFDQANAGIRSSLSRELAGIDQAFAGLFGGLSVGKGQSEAAGYSQIAALFERSGTRQASIYETMAAFHGGATQVTGWARQIGQKSVADLAGQATAALGAAIF